MQHALLAIGDIYKSNKALKDYILRAYEEHFSEIANVFFISKSNSNLPFLLEKLSQDFTSVCIFAHKDSFTLTNKILSTLTQDALTLKNDILIPSKVQLYEDNSYILKLQNCNINVLHVNEFEKLPNILLEKKEQKRTLHVLNIDLESCELLINSSLNNLNVKITPIIENWVQIQVFAKNKDDENEAINNIKQLFHKKIFEANEPMQHIINSLKINNKKICVAESCTGGLISSYFTKFAGSSSVYEGGLCTYSNAIKSSWLGVDEGVLDTHGAVSEVCVQQMLDGALKASQCDFSIATSGIAGPDGGSSSKPVGTIFIGVANKEGKFLVQRFLLKGDRNYIQQLCIFYAMKMLFDLQSDIFL